jgi:hypothetical protein
LLGLHSPLPPMQWFPHIFGYYRFLELCAHL